MATSEETKELRSKIIGYGAVIISLWILAYLAYYISYKKGLVEWWF